MVRNSRWVWGIAVLALWFSWWFMSSDTGVSNHAFTSRVPRSGGPEVDDPPSDPRGVEEDEDPTSSANREADENPGVPTDGGLDGTAGDDSVVRARVEEVWSVSSPSTVQQAPGGEAEAPRVLRFSRDGRRLSFLRGGKTLVVELDTGKEFSSEDGFLGMDWLSNTEMVGIKGGRLYRWPIGSTAREVVRELDEPGGVLWPRADPEGDVVVYVSKTSVNAGDIHWVKLSDGIVRRHMSTSSREWAPSAFQGRLAFEGTGGISLGRLDSSSAQTLGSPRAQYPTVRSDGVWFTQPRGVGGVLWWVPDVGPPVVSPAMQMGLGPVSAGSFGAVVCPLVNRGVVWWVQPEGRIIELDLDTDQKVAELVGWGSERLTKVAWVSSESSGTNVMWAGLVGPTKD